MERDMDSYRKACEANTPLQKRYFDQQKAHAILEAEAMGNERLLRKAQGMRFEPKYKSALNHGHCTRFNKPVRFLPNTIQLETQNCFEHRRTTNQII